jgi:hypothetical protein
MEGFIDAIMRLVNEEKIGVLGYLALDKALSDQTGFKNSNNYPPVLTLCVNLSSFNETKSRLTNYEFVKIKKSRYRVRILNSMNKYFTLNLVDESKCKKYLSDVAGIVWYPKTDEVSHLWITDNRRIYELYKTLKEGNVIINSRNYDDKKIDEIVGFYTRYGLNVKVI